VPKPIRIGAALPPQYLDYADIRALWVELEALGVDVIFGTDHFVASRGPGKNFEGTTMLAALASATKRVSIGSLVLCSSFRNPNVVADIARTIDHISGGRFILGLGVGSAEDDFLEYGYPLGTLGERARVLASTLATVRARLPRLDPPPLGKLPILVGGGGEKVVLRAAAEHADIWHWAGDLETMTQRSARLDEWCIELGRDPEEIERAVTPRRHEDADALHDAGFTTFVHVLLDTDLGRVRELVRWRDELNRTAGAT
jgi:probable F420-dependent oxidoreductase